MWSQGVKSLQITGFTQQIKKIIINYNALLGFATFKYEII